MYNLLPSGVFDNLDWYKYMPDGTSPMNDWSKF